VCFLARAAPSGESVRGEGLVWLIGAVVFASCMPRVQLYVNACNGWPQFATTDILKHYPSYHPYSKSWSLRPVFTYKLRLALLRPPNFHCRCGTAETTPPSRCFAVFSQSFWALFPENCPSVPQSNDSHLNVMWFDRREHNGESSGISVFQDSQMIWHNIHLFLINNPSLDTDQYSPPAPWWHVKKTLPLTELQFPATVTTLLTRKSPKLTKDGNHYLYYTKINSHNSTVNSNKHELK